MTVHLALMKEADCEDDYTAMVAGKLVNDELSDAAMHDKGVRDPDLSEDFVEVVPERALTQKMPSSSACASNDSVLQPGQYKRQTFHDVTRQS